MNRSTLRNLGIVLFALIAILIGLEMADDSRQSAGSGDLLFDGLRADINDIDDLTIEQAGEETIDIRRNDSGWVVGSRDDYPADVAKIRELLVGLSDARVLELKTANPERYEALGVQDPENADSSGVRLTLSGGSADYAVVVGKDAPGDGRYVRIVNDEQSVLIDRDLALPESAGDWLVAELVDIPRNQVRAVVVTHEDGEELGLGKATEDESDFTVENLPEGRELSYPTVANSIAGALDGLELEDVRASSGLDAETQTVFTTFDGLVVTVSVFPDGDETWIALSADVPEVIAADVDAQADDGTDADAADDAPTADPAVVADEINTRAAGREFRIASFKANQLRRRWDDILKAEETDDE